MLNYQHVRLWRGSLSFIILIVFTTVGLLSCGSTRPPYDTTEALKTFEIDPGFTVELFAYEPNIVDPVAMAFDEYGRIYVVESPGYPLETGERLGRVKLLEDTDEDGLPDRVTLFADKLTLPTGVMRWKNGILVTDAPNIWYFEDTDRDGRADKRRVVLTGFAFTNPQHTVNSPLYGLDNWIYLAHRRPVKARVFSEKFGDHGTAIHFPDRDDLPSINPEGRYLRFRPDSYELELLSGSSQFGHTFDAWGRHFGVLNPIPGRHEVIAARYLERNPDLAVSEVMQTLSEDRHVAFITEQPESPRKNWGFFDGFGQLTSACGITCYLGGAFGEKYRGIAFIAEPAHNGVLAQIWSPSGVSFQARRLNPKREFLVSRDSWFRPVNFSVGPDGALYVVDYYRRIIEHPEWTSREIYESDAIYHGNDKGRIYRIVSKSNPQEPPKRVNLGDLSTKELVEQLKHPNAWYRRTSQRLLIDRGGDEAVTSLRLMVRDSTSGMGRLHALWTLEGLGRLDTQLIDMALQAPEGGLRENAILLAERRLAQSLSLQKRLIMMTDDPDARVRFQLLCTLGNISSSAARIARDTLLMRDISDRWMQIAALSSSSEDALRLFSLATSKLTNSDDENKIDFLRKTSSVIGVRAKRNEIQSVFKVVVKASKSSDNSDAWSSAILIGLTEGLRTVADATKVATQRERESMVQLFETRVGLRRAAVNLLQVIGLPESTKMPKTLSLASRLAANTQAVSGQRVDAINLLALANPSAHKAILKKLIDPKEPQEVQSAAINALGNLSGTEIAVLLLERWRAMTSVVRTEAVKVLRHDAERIRLLFDAIRENKVQPWTINSGTKQRLLTHPNESIRYEAEKLIRVKTSERERMIERYEQAVTMEGDIERGRAVFNRVCEKCHTINGVGNQMGPDLGEVRNRPRELLLADILIPNKSIAQQYESYVVELASGEVLDGVIGEQTPTTITIRQEEGTERAVYRSSIRNFYLAELSAMPEDIDKQVSVQQMADLLRFIKRSR